MSITGSVFDGNTAGGLSDFGGGGGAISTESQVSATNSTFSTNRAVDGGAISAGEDVVLTCATVAGNSARDGVNVRGQGLESFGSVVVGPGEDGANCEIAGIVRSSYSYDDDGSCGFAGEGDTSGGQDPALGALGDNGGPTATPLPGASSPLLEAIPVAACDPQVTTYQRGVARPQRAGCDIGAVEVEVFELDPNPEPDLNPLEPDRPPTRPDPDPTGLDRGLPEPSVAECDPTPQSPGSGATTPSGSSRSTLPRTGWPLAKTLAVDLWLVSLGATAVVWATRQRLRARSEGTAAGAGADAWRGSSWSWRWGL